MKRVLLYTLGCKVNQYETAAFKTEFEIAGLQLVKKDEEADLIVINTCAVTASAGAQSRQVIRKLIRNNPAADLVITGCYAELAADELAEDTEIAKHTIAFIGNSNKDKLVPTALDATKKTVTNLMGNIREAREICRLPVQKFGERSRAYLRIQDGCESYCTYCIVPYTRGPSRSLPLDEVITQAQVFAEEGHKEIVLTGIHLGYYGNDLTGGGDFVQLLDRLSIATPGVLYRISSLEPTEITEKLLDLLTERPNIQPHLHIPLQSGDDDILQKMNRRYTTRDFRRVIELCHSRVPNLGIGIDILAGFPGETTTHFSRALEFLKSLDFSYLHVFPYSIRPGTKAATFSDQVTKTDKEDRVAALRQLSQEKTHLFYASQLGRTLPVLVEGRRNSSGQLKGFTGNYVSVCFSGPDALCNTIATVRLDRLDDNHVIGNQVEQL